MEPSTSSGLKSSDAVISARPCRIMSIIAVADGTNQATIDLYDNATAGSGTLLAKIVVDAGLTYELFHIDGGIAASNGAYLDLTGTGAGAIVHFAPL